MKRLRSNQGQMTIEAVLILVIGVAFAKVAMDSIKNQELLSQMVSGPWSYVQGMVQNGVWAPANQGSAAHPNVFGRRASPEPL
jgi:hypothetical protein